MQNAIYTHIAHCQGVTEWVVLIGYFLLSVCSNHTQKWYSEKAVECVLLLWHCLALEIERNFFVPCPSVQENTCTLAHT